MNNTNTQKIILQKRRKIKELQKQIDSINDDIHKLQSDLFNNLQTKFDFLKQEQEAQKRK
jgi:TolA-binding protein